MKWNEIVGQIDVHFGYAYERLQCAVNDETMKRKTLRLYTKTEKKEKQLLLPNEQHCECNRISSKWKQKLLYLFNTFRMRVIFLTLEPFCIYLK